MGRRRELGNIANALACSFVTRNNDVDGYWELGKLYKEFGPGDVLLDLLNSSITPYSGIFLPLVEFWQFKFHQHLKSRNIPTGWVGSANITVTLNAEFVHKLHNFGSALGDPCTCVCEIATDHGRRYKVTRGTNCKPHDPKKEHRSTRRYESFIKLNAATED